MEFDTFFDALSSNTEGLFDGIIDFIKDTFGAFEGLLSSNSDD